MHHNALRFLALLAAPVLAIGLFASLSDTGAGARAHFPEKVNLALRRTAHHLLAKAGDKTSTIPPVEHILKNTWIVRFERPFDYAALPGFLQESFDLHGITADYDVMVLDCHDDLLLLGYNKRDHTENNEPPCGSREQTAGCYNLQVTFAETHTPASGKWLFWLALLTILPLGYWAHHLWKKRTPAGMPPVQEADAPESVITFGQSAFNVANQVLIVAGVRHDLTYREAKLLQLFYERPNQLLERDFILQSVWADEGILVGRSVDMFVSRLRKLLRADAAVNIVTVHGVGYRLEVNASTS